MNKSDLKCLLVVVPFIPVELPCIGFPYIASALKVKGYDVKIEDLNLKINNLNSEHMLYMDNDLNQMKFYDQYLDYFLDWIDSSVIKPGINVIGFTVWASNFNIIKKLSQLIKQKNKDVIIICGGPGHSELYKAASKDIIDVIVKGEGEKAIVEIFDSLVSEKSLDGIKSIISINNRGEFIESFEQEEIEDINTITFPDFTDLNLFEYELQEIPLMFSRGCSWRCKFCTVCYQWNKFRTRTADNIFQEITARLQQYKRCEYKFQLYDCACNQNMTVLSQLCDKIIKLNLPYNKVTFVANAKVIPEMDYDFLKKMKMAGFVMLRLGIESGSDRVLKLMSKPFKSSEASELLQNMFKIGITSVITIIVGFPGETEEDWDDTVEFLRKNSQYVSDIFLNFCSITHEMASARFKDIVDPNYEDPNYWNSKDMKNTYEIRKARLIKLDKALSQTAIKIVEPMRHYTNRR